MLEQLITPLLEQAGITPEKVRELYDRFSVIAETIEEMDAKLSFIEEYILENPKE